MRRRLLVAGLLGAMSAVLAISPATASSAERPDAEPRSPQPVKHPIERVLIISLPGVGWRELSGQHLPNLRRVLEGAAVADLSTRAPLLREDLAGNYASLNAGDKAVGPRDEIDRTGVAPAGAAYNVDERLTGTTAGEVFTHRTGRAAGAGLVVLGVGQVAAANAATPYRAKIGALGDVLAGAGWTRSVIANGDGLDVGLLAGRPRRAAAIALMGADGTVPAGELDARLLMVDPASPFGVRLDPAAVDAAFAASWVPRSVVLVEGSDLVRAEEYRAAMTRRRGKELRSEALRATDEMVGRLLARVDPARDAVVLVGTAPNPVDGRLAAVAVRAPGVPAGLLRSGTTQRTGFVQLMDVAPSVLALVGIETPATMRGRAVAVGRRTHDLAASQRFLVDADDAARFRGEIQGGVATAYIALVLVLIGLAFAAARRPRSRWASAANWWAAVTLAFIPTVYLARAIPFHAIGAPGYWLWIALVSVAFAAGAQILGRGNRLDPVIGLLGLTFVVLGADVVIGSPLQFNGPLGFSPEVAGRFIGFGNAGFAAFAACALFLACVLVVRDPRRGRWWAVGVLVAAVVLDGSPFWGADVGGVLSLVPAFGIVAACIMGWRVRLRTALLALGGTAIAVGAAIGIDMARAPGSRTHLGRLVEQIGREGPGEFVDVVFRKLQMNGLSWTTSPFRWLLPVIVLAVIGLWRIRASGVAKTGRSLDGGGTLVLGFSTLVVLGCGLNDTGVLVPVLMAVTGLAVLVSVANATREAPEYGRVEFGGGRYAVRQWSHRS